MFKIGFTNLVAKNIIQIIIVELLLLGILIFIFPTATDKILLSIFALIISEIQFLTVFENKEIAKKKLMLEIYVKIEDSTNIIINRLEFLLKENNNPSNHLLAACMVIEEESKKNGKIIVFDENVQKALKDIKIIDKYNMLTKEVLLSEDTKKKWDELLKNIMEKPEEKEIINKLINDLLKIFKKIRNYI